ncbi:uncharacterized protein LOC116251171 isoform X2 [Nymphaea colorata]|uniref:uncharacterized protein LOC116251171 isoform X2 n=1 Tax=Nymphaea colorata TaxID=210225 RepID=UPI00214E7FDD|nr:uncharacterized protein LOC116251171 isoform X2 [Nymphaea colorata]
MTAVAVEGENVAVEDDADGGNKLDSPEDDVATSGVGSYEPKLGDSVSREEGAHGNDEPHNLQNTSNSYNSEDDNYVPKLGMEFDDEHSVFQFYNFYAQKLGFSVRVNSWNMNTKGVLTRKTFTCYKEGYPRPRPNGGVIKIRPNARCGCPARLIVKRGSNNRLYVAEFEPRHNHQLASPNEVHMLRSHRNVTKAHAAIVDLADSLGLTPKPIYTFIEKQFGGKSDNEKSVIATRFSVISNALIKIAIMASESEETYKYLESQSTMIKDVVECMLKKNTSPMHASTLMQNSTPAADSETPTGPSTEQPPNVKETGNCNVQENENERGTSDTVNSVKKKDSRDQRRTRAKRILEEKRKKRRLEVNVAPLGMQAPATNTAQGRAMHVMPWGVQYSQQMSATENPRSAEANMVDSNRRVLGKHVYGVYVPVILPYVIPQSSQEAPTFTKLMVYCVSIVNSRFHELFSI